MTLEQIKQEQLAIIKEWSQRQYKENYTVVTTSDAAWNGGASNLTTISKANEARKLRVINAAKSAIELIDGLNVRFPICGVQSEIEDYANNYAGKAKHYPASFLEVVKCAIEEKQPSEGDYKPIGEFDASDLFGDLI